MYLLLSEKNKFLAPVEKVNEINDDELNIKIKQDEPKGEHDKRKASRPKPEDLR